MGEHDALEKAQFDHEQRIRTMEATLGVLKSQLDQMVTNTEDIKTRISFLTTGTATQEHLHRVEAMVTSAHKRLDEFNKEFWKLQAEHANCIRVKDDTTESMNELKDALNALKLDINNVQISVRGLQKDKDAVSTFFSGRLGTMTDKIIQLLPWAIFYLYMYYHSGPIGTTAKALTK